MPITPILSCNYYPTDLQDRFKQGNEDFQRLARALISGDLAGAQKAFEAFRQDIQNIQRMKNGRQTTSPLHYPHHTDSTQAAVNHDAGIGIYIDVVV